MEVKIGSATLEIVEGDITQQDTDAIVNAANSRWCPVEAWTGPSTGPAAPPSRPKPASWGAAPREKP
jgi:O-acetyl-ADP-ribose deacetylase